MQTEIFLADEDQTTLLARRLSGALKAGDTLCLSGPVGAGKSHFARSIIASRLEAEGRAEDIPSPSFTLVQTYALADVEIWHADLYRLSGPDDILELGLEEAFETAITLIEWPDRLQDLRPARWIEFAFSHPPDGAGRKVRVSRSGSWLHIEAILTETPVS